MKLLIIFSVTILAVNALSLHEEWSAFKVKHDKSYKQSIEEQYRFGVFQSNLKRIEEHNAKYKEGKVSYFLGVNTFADMTPEEFEQKLLHQMEHKPKIQGAYHDFSGVKAPESLDWRDKGAVLGVKDQGSCGSCWAFSTTGALEGQNFLLNNVSIPLSEQELMDCSWLYQNQGCGGGLMTKAFEYVQAKGVSSEESYPYKAENDGCHRNASNIILKIKDYNVVAPDETSLKNAIASVGPIAVAVYATNALQLYAGGIYDEESCTNFLRNHGVLAIGYGNAEGKDFWHVKNSWGAGWGENGFYRMKRNPSICAILTDASFPLLQ